MRYYLWTIKNHKQVLVKANHRDDAYKYLLSKGYRTNQLALNASFTEDELNHPYFKNVLILN